MNDRDVARPATLEVILSDTKAIGFGMASELLTGALLRTLAASKPSGQFLELGTGTGVGTAWLADGMDAASSLLTVDSNAEASAIARRHLGHDKRIRFHVGDGAELLCSLAGQSRFDLIFADTWPGKFDHLEDALRLLKLGGLYVIDDLLPQENWPAGHEPKVAALVSELESRSDLRLVKLRWASGIIVATKCVEE